MNYFDVRIAFPLDWQDHILIFFLSFDYPLRVLIALKVIVKASRTSGILNTLCAQKMLTMKTSYISHFALLELKFVPRDRSM